MYRLAFLLLAAQLVKATVVTNDHHCAYPTIPPSGAPKCGLNEVFSECGANGCQNTCQEPKRLLVCLGLCTPGCICAPGYLRNSKGACVLIKDCDCTGVNEVFSECDNHPCQNTCSNPNIITRCSYVVGCYPGCICKPQYLRDDDGICVPQRQCFNCNANETFQDNGVLACESTCRDPHFFELCDPINPQVQPACFCKFDYVRNDNGECILREDCPKCTGVNEVYSYNKACERNCDNYDQADFICNAEDSQGCVCKEGYIRNQQGICVTPDRCENRKCTGKNEAFTTCVIPCGERCSNLGQDVICNFLVCNPGCDCKPGFFRNSKNEGVPPAECDCNPNEELDLCHNNCPPRTCNSIGKTFKCPAPDPNKCRPACKCKFNYFRNSEGVCVPIEQCPPLTCTGENEVYDFCPLSCLEETCSGMTSPRVCTLEVRECAPACVCIEGFLRNSEGKCRPESECACADPNAEVVRCPNPCPGGTCEFPEFANCDAPCRIKGCQCKKGYVKNKGGKCILLSQCPNRQCAGQNEEYLDCGTGCPATCENRIKKIACPNKNCVPGCFCKNGFVRKNGKCVKWDECDPPTPVCGTNEIFSKAAPIVQETCATLGKHICKDYKLGCVCNTGYVRDVINGKCIKKTDCNSCKKCVYPSAAMAKVIYCLVIFISATWLVEATVAPVDPHCAYPTKGPPKCRLNEVYSDCGNNKCQNTCQATKLSETCDGPCIPGCICVNGYFRNSKGVCVLLKDCDCMKENEIFDVCGPSCVNTCEEPNLIARLSCLAGCFPGCFCKPNFLRDKNGNCVPQSKCYKCKANEVFKDCGRFQCENTCTNTNAQQRCNLTPCEPGCYCNQGYLRDVDGQCVLREDCQYRKCKGKNEEYSLCIAPCGERCSNLGQDLVCNYNACKIGCDCKPGYLRNSKNECVLISECDCNKNEELDICYNKCPPRTCDAIGKGFECPPPDSNCKPACKCIFDYRRNSDGVCIPVQKCPPLKCTGENEIYNSCPPRCLDEGCRSLYDPRVCTQEVRECSPACVCKDGYLRNLEGNCILKTQCPEYCSDPNAVFGQCGNFCPTTCKNKDIPNRVCPGICKVGGGCVCKLGFVENDKGLCIPPEKCPLAPCGDNETYSKTAPVVQETCATLNKHVCKDYKPGCVCNPGYVREFTNGKCIKPCCCKNRRK
ncbi:zonadhesin-like [Arctopsyche grandis]|uniref:zonadhesin-like n=1 Tax=Arctopsyche grandis TaxID=121162 RepID=UPI00406D7820